VTEKNIVTFFAVRFYGWPCETMQTVENVGKNAASKSSPP